MFTHQGENTGSDSFKDGNLTRHIATVSLAILNSTLSTSAALAIILKVQGLTQALTLHVCVAAVGPEGAPIKPEDYPAAPGTWQMLPIVKAPDSPRIYLREVFQDPTATDNKNNPLPQDIPFGWSFEPEGAQEAEIDVVIPVNGYAATDLNGKLVCNVVAMYTANWMTPEAFEFAVSKVRVIGAPDSLVTIGTGEG